MKIQFYTQINHTIEIDDGLITSVDHTVDVYAKEASGLPSEVIMAISAVGMERALETVMRRGGEPHQTTLEG